MPAGRPRKEIDWQAFERLCAIQCTLEEIARFFRCSEDTIERAVKRHYREQGKPALNFADVYKKYMADGKISLRRAQFRTAIEDKNPTMQIWLGKQYLGQTDRQELQHTGPNGEPLSLGGTVNIYLPDNGRGAPTKT